MAEEMDLSFGKVAIEKGFLSSKQLDEAAEILSAVRKLGLEEDLGTILVKKKFITENQAKEIRELQGKRSGVRIAGYEIMEKIGQGGMGVVFKARQVSLDRIVALKILNPKLAEDKAFTERFTREAQAVAKLSHPNIIVGIDVGQHGKYFYFAMEYVEGRTGLEILRNEERFKEADALKIAQQMTRALEHAHKNNLVHRDIKPDNIMVTAKGEAKLCDLGLAKRLDIGDNLQPGTAVGTPHYIAPEQARGRDDVDIRADIYALGASLYHMTTGRTLFHGETAASIMTQHLSTEAPNARKIRPELSESFCRLLERMLAKNREDRYQTPQELQEDIDRLIEGKPLKGALKADAPCSMERTARRARPPAQLSSRGTTGPRTPVGPPDPTTGPRPPVQTRPVGMILAGAGIGLLVLAGLGFVFLKRSEPTPDPRNTAKLDPPLPSNNTKPDEKKTPVAVTTNPAIPPTWQPLEAARQARQSKPEDFVRLIGLYEQAEQGAPRELLTDIRREKRELMERLNTAIARKVDAQWEMAQTRLTNRDYSGALACFDEEQLPADLKCEATTQQWNTKLKDVQQQIWLEFYRRVAPDLKQEIQLAAEDTSKLEAVRLKLQGLPKEMPVEEVKREAARLDQELQARIAQITTTRKRAQSEDFRVALDEAKRTAGSSEAGAQLKAAEKLETRKEYLAGNFKPIAEQFAKDLRTVQAIYEKSWGVLAAKGEAKETVEFFYPAGSDKKQTFRLTGKISGSDAGVSYEVNQGVGLRLPFSKLDDRDVLALAGITEATEEGRKKLGIFHFWRNNPDRAYELLLPFKGDRFGYVDWMDQQASDLIGDAEELYRQVMTLELSGIEKERRRRQAEKIVKQLKDNYGATEVFRKRAQDK